MRKLISFGMLAGFLTIFVGAASGAIPCCCCPF